jgi:cytoskeletal protein CcmA (bactofilin family)
MLPTYTGNINAGNITANSIVSSGTGAATLSSTSDINLTSSGNINIFAANIRLGNIIVDNIRANSWSGLIAGNNIIIAANGQISANLLAASVNVNSVSGNLAVSGNVIANGAVIANSIISTGSGSASLSSSADINLSATGNINLVASNVYTSNITVNRITSNIWSGLYAANVIGLNTANVAELTNLYYTNARVYSNVIGLIGGKANVSDLTTANVTELTNLYYTNARVYSNVIALLPTLAGSGIAIAANGQITSTATSSSYGNANVEAFITTYTGNINAGNITANSIISSGASTGAISATADIILTAGGNINLVAANVFTSNITVNRITANAWVGITASNVVGLTTANVTELTNLYYTNARVYSNVIGLIAGKANVSDLTTANVAELTNLYYTNTRTYSNTIALLPTLAGSGIAIAANGQISSTASGTYSNANVAAFLTTYTGNINAGNITANSIISAGASTGAISATADIILTAGGNINLVASNVYTSNITVNNITSNIWSGLYAANVIGLNTANVTELTNLYYTNARVYSNVIALLQTLAGNNIIISANGQISANLLAAGGGSASSVLANGVIGLNTANVNEFGSNLYYTNARVYSNVIGILSTYTGNVGAGNVIISSGGSITGANLISTNVISATNWIGLYAANVIGLTTANVTELTNLYYTNARVYSNVIGLLNAKANVVDLTTANVAELTNLYYTNARVYSNVIALLPTLAGAGIAIAANGQISSTAASSSYGNANVAAFITTYSGNISAGNIIANAIVSGGTGGGGSITGANLISANNIIANTIISGYGGGGSITGANLISANNIIANSIISGSSGGGAITGANLIQSNNISSLNWIGLYTSNIIQSSGNLFLSNATLRDTILNLTDGSLAVDANGRIGVNFYANSQIITASSSFVNYNLNYSNTTNSSIFVAIEGIIQIPGVDYYVNGQTLTLTSAPDTGANIEVRYMGLKQSQGPQTPSTSMDTISAFLLMGA